MNYHLRILATCLLTAVIAGCGQSRPDDERVPAAVSARQLDEATFNAGLDPNDKRIVALVAWLKHKGVTLEYAGSPEGGGWWRVTEPKTSEDYDVVFSIRSFPSWASEAQMRAALDVNLAYQLNAPAHLAMSYAIFSGTHPDARLPKSDDELPKVNGLPITKAVERWFMEYKPGKPVAAPDRGRMEAFRGSTAQRRPQRVSVIVSRPSRPAIATTPWRADLARHGVVSSGMFRRPRATEAGGQPLRSPVTSWDPGGPRF